jgi:hypothetical protein
LSLFERAWRIPSSDGSYAWLRLGISLLLGTIGGAGMWAVIVVLPMVQADFGVDRSMASLPYTATMLGFAAGNVLLAGQLSDRFGSCGRPSFQRSRWGSASFWSLAPSVPLITVMQGALIGAGLGGNLWPADRRHVAVVLPAARHCRGGCRLRQLSSPARSGRSPCSR